MRKAIVLLCLLACFDGAFADQLDGRVVSVTDGDTITLIDGSYRHHKIRLAGIDAPEKGQAFGQRSKEYLSQLAHGKAATAECYKIDLYNRQICTVFVNGTDVALAQLHAGLALWFRRYANEQPQQQRVDYESAEDRASANRLGLWQDEAPVPPWDWRKR
jgi:endonuclease YncB( thermonuclease family)